MSEPNKSAVVVDKVLPELEGGTEEVFVRVISDSPDSSYADIEIKNDGEVLGKTRLMLFA